MGGCLLRDAIFADQVVVMVGKPDFAKPVPVKNSLGLLDRKRVRIKAARRRVPDTGFST